MPNRDSIGKIASHVCKHFDSFGELYTASEPETSEKIIKK